MSKDKTIEEFEVKLREATKALGDPTRRTKMVGGVEWTPRPVKPLLLFVGGVCCAWWAILAIKALAGA